MFGKRDLEEFERSHLEFLSSSIRPHKFVREREREPESRDVRACKFIHQVDVSKIFLPVSLFLWRPNCLPLGISTCQNDLCPELGFIVNSLKKIEEISN